METKICNKCGKKKCIDEFRWKNKVSGIRRNICKDCHKEYDKEWYNKNPNRKEKIKLTRQNNLRKRKDLIIDIKKKECCKKCGEKRWYTLDFHHINGFEKELNVADIVKRMWSEEKLLEEIDKCILLCRNCHAEFHYLEREEGLLIEDFL